MLLTNRSKDETTLSMITATDSTNRVFTDTIIIASGDNLPYRPSPDYNVVHNLGHVPNSKSIYAVYVYQ